jgi:hypothetical protein
MQKERTTLKVAALLNNEGQLGWLPTNPRQWTKSDIDLTAQSLTNDPDFLEDRPLLVVPGPTAKSFIVFAGNLRLTAARQLKIKEVPGIIYTPENETDQLTIKRRSVLDNGSFGAWDYDALANEWDDLPLGDWGVPAWNNEEEDEMPTDLDAEPKNAPFVCKITFPDADSMTRFVTAYKDVLEQDYGCTISESGGEL